MRKEKDFTIAGRKLKITHLDFATAMEVLTLLYKHLAGPLAVMSLSPKQFSQDNLSQALNQLAQTLSAADLKKLVAEFAKVSRVETQTVYVELEPELHLAGENLVLLPQWLKTCMEYNFADFLLEMGLGLAKKS